MTPLVLLILLADVPKPKPIQLIGRFATAQLCPVSEELALTCAHVVDPRPLDPDVKLYPAPWSDVAGHEGLAQPLATLAVCDLALVSGRFPHWYELGVAPEPGARVRFAGYDWSNKGKAYLPREFTAKVLRNVAGHVILDHAGEHGSSGACVLDEQDRVVAVNCAGHVMDSGEEVGRAVGTWTAWVRELLGR